MEETIRIIAAAVLLAGIMIADRIMHKQERDFEQ